MGFYNNSDGSSIVNGLSYVPRYKSHELSKRPGEILVGSSSFSLYQPARVECIRKTELGRGPEVHFTAGSTTSRNYRWLRPVLVYDSDVMTTKLLAVNLEHWNRSK